MPKLKDTPKIDRPRERFLEKGADALSKSELLAIMIGSGTKDFNVKKVAEKIIRTHEKDFLSVTVDDLKKIPGIGPAKALQIVSAIALTKRFTPQKTVGEKIISMTNDALAETEEFRDKNKEHLICLYINARNVLLHKEVVSIGTLDRSIVHPREIFAPGLKLNASGVVLVHNHPSGDPSPSQMDKDVAKKIVEAGKLMGVNVVDFLIIATNGEYSLLGELSEGSSKDAEYVADGAQSSLFDFLVDASMAYIPTIPAKILKRTSKDKPRIIDLFAGIGGFHIAFENVGAHCVFASEWDEQARNTYRHNFEKTNPELFNSGNFAGDITQVKPETIPDFEILCAGFPCQPFSQAGFKKGFKETRGTLFFDIANIIDKKRPEAFFLENVRHLFKHDDGKTFATIKKVIEEDLGYSFFYKIVKASDYGVPQHRPRLFMVGFKDKTIDFKFPDPKPLMYTLSDIFGGKVEKKIGFTLRVGGRGSSLHDRRNWDAYVVDGQQRRLGWKEGLKMQGFPDTFQFPVTAVQAMKQLGNSVAVPAIQAVAEEIVKTLKTHARN